MPRNKRTSATQAETTAIVPHLRNRSERKGGDTAAARDADDFTGGRLTREAGVEDTSGAAEGIFSSRARDGSALANESGFFVEWSENSCERAELGCAAKLSLPVEVFRKSLKAF